MGSLTGVYNSNDVERVIALYQSANDIQDEKFRCDLLENLYLCGI